MDAKALDFLVKHRIGVLSVLLKDGSPHASTLHYVCNRDSVEVYIMTENTSKKCESILDGEKHKASFVTGFSDEEWTTLQMDGEVHIETDGEKLKKIHEIYFKGNPSAEKYKDDPETAFLVFIPNWWRYTEFKPKFLAISSDNEG